MKTLSIWWGNQSSSLITKPLYHSALQDYQANFGKTLILEQIHSAKGHIVTRSSIIQWAQNRVPQGDYLITRETNLSLGVLTADCLPIIFFDRQQQVVAIAHAGWRGSVAGISQTVVANLIEYFATNLNNLQIFLGPAAKNCCYEVDASFVKNLSNDQVAQKCLKKRGESYFFDVSSYNVLCLQNCGVPMNNFNLQNNVCTICNPGYCSYRKAGMQTGLQLSLVTLR